MANQSRQAPDGQSRYRGVSELPAASDGSVVGDYSAVVRDSQAAVLASAERITVVGRWVVLAAAAILNHLGNRNPASSVPIVDTILFLWSLVNLVVSVVLVRGYRPNRWFGPKTSQEFSGTVTPDGFIVSRRVLSRNSFVPVITGRLEWLPGRTRIRNLRRLAASLAVGKLGGELSTLVRH